MKFKFLFLFIAALIGMNFWAYAQKPPADAIIAIVNNDVITLKDLKQYIDSIGSQLRVENKSPGEIQQIMMNYEEKGVDKLIEDKLILAAANDKGIEVRADMIDKRLKEIKARYPSENDFLNAIGTEGLTVSDLQQKLTDQMKVKYEVDMEVKDKTFVNPQEVTEYYNAHRLEFTHKLKVNVQSIFISWTKYGKLQARSRADEARSKMLAGEDFDTVFKAYSESASIGEIEEGQMIDAVANVIFNLKLDEVSDPVEVENGIYVFKAVGIAPAKEQSLAEVKDQIYGKLLDDKFQSKFKDWVKKLRDKAYIEIK